MRLRQIWASGRLGSALAHDELSYVNQLLVTVEPATEGEATPAPGPHKAPGVGSDQLPGLRGLHGPSS